MREYILAIVLFGALNAQLAPQWGSISCDSSLTDRFPPGVKYTTYDRYYTFTADYPTSIRRDAIISTCIENNPRTMIARIEGNADIFDATNPGTTRSDVGNENCAPGEPGHSYRFAGVPEGDWEIGVYSVNATGGKYKLSVECPEGTIPPASQYKEKQNITTAFEYLGDWATFGSKKISCGANAYSTIGANEEFDWYEFTLTQYGQKLIFTTCTPETAQSCATCTPYDGTTISNHRLVFYYWDFDTYLHREWDSDRYGYGSCSTISIGDAYNISQSELLKLSPGTYYIGVQRTDPTLERNYVLSMMCWNNDAVANAVAGTDYNVATFNPTLSPITANPTVASPTFNNPQTPAPSNFPTVTFDGYYDKIKKTMKMGELSCGIHQKGILQAKTSDYYIFEVFSSTTIYIDTCMNDLTRFDAAVQIYQYGGVNDDDFYTYGGASTSYCNLITYTLNPNIYYIEIRGQDKKTDFGEYVIRMGCGYQEEDQVRAVSSTSEPTPSPTGIRDIPTGDGSIVGDISCGLTVMGEISAQSGDFHKLTVIKGGIDWVKFDTCDETSFENYLFFWDFWNQTAHEHWNYESYNSIGFHYEDDTTCNELVMNDLVPGVYYVNIDGYNYYFDHGEYTIKMTCSDNGAIRGASNYEEYTTPLEWWAILLIVLACLLCCGCIIFAVCYFKRKQDSDSGSDGGNTEMGNTGKSKADAGE